MANEPPNPVAAQVPARLRKLRAAASVEGLGALLISSPENVYYASGALIHTQSFMRRRQAMVVVPLGPPASLIVCGVERGLAQRESQLDELVAYQEFAESAIQRAVSCLSLAGLSQGAIGIESSHLPACDYDTLRASLPRATFPGCDDLLRRVRSCKSVVEIEAIRFVARAMDRAIAGAVAATRVGATEEDLSTRIVANTLGLGAGAFRAAVGLVAAGANRRVPHHVADTKRLEKGEVVRTGCRAVYEGYHAMVVRTTVVGAPSEAVESRYRALRSAHTDLLESLVPGARAATVYERAKTTRTALGLAFTSSHVGHGMGVEFQEPPRLRRDGPDEIAPGTVLLTSSVVPDPEVGHLYLDDLVLVGSEGATVLSDYTPTDRPLVIDA